MFVLPLYTCFRHGNGVGECGEGGGVIGIDICEGGKLAENRPVKVCPGIYERERGEGRKIVQIHSRIKLTIVKREGANA